MNIFVKDRAESIFLLAFRRERNVIYVFAGLEIARDPFVRLAVTTFWFIRPIRTGTLEDHDVRRDRARELRVRKDRSKGRSKLFELCRDEAGILLARVAYDRKVRRLYP